MSRSGLAWMLMILGTPRSVNLTVPVRVALVTLAWRRYCYCCCFQLGLWKVISLALPLSGSGSGYSAYSVGYSMIS